MVFVSLVHIQYFDYLLLFNFEQCSLQMIKLIKLNHSLKFSQKHSVYLFLN